MPNYVKNILIFDADDGKIREIANKIKGHKSCFDFGTLIPMANTLSEVADDRNRIRLATRCFMADDFEKYTIMMETSISEDEFDALRSDGEKYIKNKILYGHATWYGWRLEKWGTKWNAWDCEWTDVNELTFYTAWSNPRPVIDKLADIFMDVPFEHKYADEDIGSNCGIVEYENGEIIEEWHPYGEEAEAFAKEIWDN